MLELGIMISAEILATLFSWVELTRLTSAWSLGATSRLYLWRSGRHKRHEAARETGG
jgi:hypothetical protein